jgi:ribonuclease E
MPRVGHYELPTATLVEMTHASQLEWVQSDPIKVRTTQERMAQEPKVVHPKRERPPAVSLEQGPLVLVETKRDLSQLNLPFAQ